MDWAAVELDQGELRLWPAGADRFDPSFTLPCASDPAAVLSTMLVPMLAPGQSMAVMASGWPGVDPVRVPCRPGQPASPLAIHPQITLHPLPGLVQDQPVDLIDTPVPRITGHLALNPDFDGVLCLPGRTSTWVQISAAEVVSFRSFLTDTIMAALTTGSGAEPGNDAIFAEAVAQSMSRPATLAAELSSVRAGLALDRIDGATAQDRIAGLLIGAELAAARPWWLGQNVVILGRGWIGDRYAAALAAQGVIANRADPVLAWLSGMEAAHRLL